MKCNKCNNIVKESDTFCHYCGEEITKEIIKNDKKTNQKLLIIFSIEIIVIVLLFVFINNYYNKHFDNHYANEKEFLNYIETKDVKVENAKEKNDGLKKYYYATNDNEDLAIHYIIAEKKYANNVYYNLQDDILSRQVSGYQGTVTIDLFGYNYYSFENGGNYYVAVKNGNTIFSAMGTAKYKDEINTMVEDLNFDYPDNVIYIILSIVLVIFVITYVVMWKIFVKANLKGWYSLIPLYNYYCLCKIAFNSGWYFLLMLITPINLVFIPTTCYKIARAFGKSQSFAICSLFFPYITLQIVAFDKSKYIGTNK